eukprot:scaffold26688_cov137-Cylindrotheca_fusiformis.AAC.3
MASAIKTSLKNAGSAGPADRALGAAASLGLCLAILRLVGSAYGASSRLENGDQFGAVKSPSSRSSTGSASNFIVSYVRNFLRRMLLAEEDLDIMDPNPSSYITHAGSCHCQSVVFEVVAPRSLQARDRIGKIQYRHAKVKTSNFKVFKGQERLKTYYVVSDGSSHDKGAHAFCQDCGVHILYAPWKNSPHLFINVNCLAEGIRKVRLDRGADSILDVVPADGQWDAASTVSEVSGDSRWNFFQHQDSSASSGFSTADTSTWKYDRAIDEHSAVTPSVSETSYVRKPHQISLSPTMTAATESQISSDTSSLMRMDGDDITVRTYKSTRTAPSISLKPLNPRLESPAEQHLSPAMADQMKKFMKKHLADSNNKTNGASQANKVQTMKKQNLSVTSATRTGEENKLQQQ